MPASQKSKSSDPPGGFDFGSSPPAPGIVIGKKGSEIEKLKKQLEVRVSQEVLIDIQEVRKPEVDAQLVAENVAMQIERRVAFRRAMKRGVSSAMRFGAQGVKIICSGRLGGAEMARTEWYRGGPGPAAPPCVRILTYGITEARTTYGIVGIKVFVFHGEILKKGPSRNTRLSLWEIRNAEP